MKYTAREKRGNAMPRCFVIQPFDKGPYDKRYHDVLVPAIKLVELEAYRVDQDPGTVILIDDIENGIRESDICLADITTDNPNIWYEIGFALANGKPLVLICADPRPTKFPFDIRHRQIINYTLDCPSDFKKLEKEVATRLKAQMQKAERLQTVAALSPLISTEGLSSYEIAALVSIMENRLTPDSARTPNNIRQDMRRAGYTDIAISLSLESLKRKDMIELAEDEDYNGITYDVYRLSQRGVDWILENRERFQMTQQESDPGNISDEDIPSRIHATFVDQVARESHVSTKDFSRESARSH